MCEDSIGPSTNLISGRRLTSRVNNEVNLLTVARTGTFKDRHHFLSWKNLWSHVSKAVHGIGFSMT